MHGDSLFIIIHDNFGPMMKPTIVLIGSAGAGKGTQADLIEEQLGYHRIEFGKIWRAIAKTDTPKGKIIRDIDAKGGHGSDEFVTEIIDDYIVNLPKEENLLIDGYPRSLNQAKLLKGLLEQSGRDPENVVAIWLNIPREIAAERLMTRAECKVCKTLFHTREITECPHCGGEVGPRDYDKPDAINNRLDHYEKVVTPVIEQYKEQGKLLTINGNQEIPHVFEDIKNGLAPYLESQE